MVVLAKFIATFRLYSDNLLQTTERTAYSGQWLGSQPYLVITFVKVNTFVCLLYISFTLHTTMSHCIGINSLSCMLFSQLPEEDYQSIIETLQ